MDDHLRLSLVISPIRLPIANAKQPGIPKKIPNTGLSSITGRISVKPGITLITLKGIAMIR